MRAETEVHIPEHSDRDWGVQRGPREHFEAILCGHGSVASGAAARGRKGSFVRAERPCMIDAGNSPENPSHSGSPCGDREQTPIATQTKQILPLRVYVGGPGPGTLAGRR